MAIIPLRSPRFEILTAPATSVSAKLELTIDATLRYTIIKDCTAGETVTFEIAELCRDYITPDMYVNSIALSTLSTVAISRAISFWTAVNAGGSQVSTATATYDGFDGYTDYMDGANWEIPEGVDKAYLLTQSGTYAGHYEVFVPENTAGWIVGLDGSEEKLTVSFLAGDTTETNRSSVCYITRVDCSKYTPTKVYFVNKFGAIQFLYFFTKEVEILNTNKETYQRNTIDTSTTTASYFRPKFSTFATYPHPITTFTKNGKKNYSLSSGYYPEWANAYFEQLMLSEYVWIERTLYDPPYPTPVAVQLKTSTMSFKTHLNDKLIEYTMEFEEAFDTINNVR